MCSPVRLAVSDTHTVGSLSLSLSIHRLFNYDYHYSIVIIFVFYHSIPKWLENVGISWNCTSRQKVHLHQRQNPKPRRCSAVSVGSLWLSDQTVALCFSVSPCGHEHSMLFGLSPVLQTQARSIACNVCIGLKCCWLKRVIGMTLI